MHGGCCQISRLEEPSVLLPGCPIGLCDSFQTSEEANATIAPSESTNSLHTRPWTECCFPHSLQLNYCNTPAPSNLFSVFLTLLVLIISYHSHSFLASNSNSP